MLSAKRIFVCPMDWGLGHATRVVPIIRLLLDAGVQVVIGADHQPLAFLRQRFPGMEWVRFPGFRPTYQTKGSLTLKMVITLPEMLREAEKGHRMLERLVVEKKIDAVISDNRYELWTEKVPTVFMTHQLHIPLPKVWAAGKPLVRKMIYHFIRKHDELWIPDFESEPNLSGLLSHGHPLPLRHTYFIGPLSRFEGFRLSGDEVFPAPDVLCLLSGPEPQRTLFENILTGQLAQSRLHSVLLSGKPGEQTLQKSGNLEIRSHAGDEELFRLMRSAKTIICRAGYSSVMDLVSMKKSAVLVPTPGQPEQEYLAAKLMEEGYFYSCRQKNFSLEKVLEASKPYRGLGLTNDYGILKKRISALLEKL